ncbi:MAG: hypothetical protein A2178_02560, partial [Planctomycetes bacterium GWC2_49_10]
MRCICILLAVIIAPSLSLAAYPQVKLHVTGAVTGDIIIELWPDKAPITTANFVNYVKSGFCNNTVFHRVINNFMIQGGGFTTGLVQKVTNPAIINESSNRLSNLKYTIAMARVNEADSATSQFFINDANNTGLNYGSITWPYVYNVSTGQIQQQPFTQIGYAVFGKVISGTNVVDAISDLAIQSKTLTDTSGLTYQSGDVPVNNVVITATIHVNAPVCAQKLLGDTNNDCKVDTKDFAA